MSSVVSTHIGSRVIDSRPDQDRSQIRRRRACRPIHSRVGPAFIKQTLRQEAGIQGGELSEDTCRPRERIEKLDGLSVTGERFEFDLRKSSTEALLRLNLQGVDQPTLEDRQSLHEKTLGQQVDHS